MNSYSVWEISELVSEITSYLKVKDDGRTDFKTLAVCARVSKLVSEYALDAIYREGPDMRIILGFLCPMFRVHSIHIFGSLEAIQALHSRIRSLSLIPNNFDPLGISGKSMIELLLTLPRGEAFLPSLEEFGWKGVSDMENMGGLSIFTEPASPYILLFLNDGLKDLQLSLPLHDAEIILGYLPTKAPNIERFELYVADLDLPTEQIECCQDAVVRAIRGLPLLRELEINEHWGGPTLLNKISRKPDLRSNLRTSLSPSPN
ncbi:hypothetical protein SISSUDRAFT_1061934 [Sistotremastrum suecicum HHB10207 ss-3]|uniref:Uncharacterized protein n=1 Tax=Sistotremastrum suecicum HHB10207 ss-3 TaxID=1314776 RepID=A0A166DFF3_9AGAM|nr:hypothetical protein SISSUDRAFT_1061934 [Sistotremastrum suecicum HHB10207 ss-3]